MISIDTIVGNALTLVGLSSTETQQVMGGAKIFGDSGLLDSLGLVRLIGILGVEMEESGVDLFDLLQELNISPDVAFADVASIRQFLGRVTANAQVGVA